MKRRSLTVPAPTSTNLPDNPIAKRAYTTGRILTPEEIAEKSTKFDESIYRKIDNDIDNDYIIQPAIIGTILPQQDTSIQLQDIDLPQQDTSIQLQDTDLPIQDTDLPQQDTDLPQQDTDLPIQDTQHFYYFIGRLNPPHNGHIEALTLLVNEAKRTGTKALILLGSGPKGLRTTDNPITFELKKKFIEFKLTELRFVNNVNFTIQQMTNPAQNVIEFLKTEISAKAHLPIEVTHVAGGKDEDATKLSFVLKSAEKTLKGLLPDIDINTGVLTVNPVTELGDVPMSATQVRKDAYDAYNTYGKEGGYEKWDNKYYWFYDKHSRRIYDEILYPLTNSTSISIVDEENVVKSKTKKRTKKGGTKHKKHNKKTHKRKRRVRATRRRKH